MRVYSARILLAIMATVTLVAFQNCGGGFKSSGASSTNKLAAPAVSQTAHAILRLEADFVLDPNGFVEEILIIDNSNPDEALAEQYFMDGGPNVTTGEFETDLPAGRKDLTAYVTYRKGDGSQRHFQGSTTYNFLGGQDNFVDIILLEFAPE